MGIHGIELEGGAATEYERRMADAFARFFRTLRQAANAAPDADILAPDSLPWAEASERLFADWEDIARSLGTAAAAAEVGALEGEAILVDNPWVERWLINNGAELVTQVTESTRAAIRRAVRDGVIHHETVRDTAKVLRSVIGLREDQLRGIDRAAQALIDDGVTGRALDEQLARMARQKVADRALLISRNETMRALNAGKHSGYEQAQAQGLLLEQTVRVWIGSGRSPRTCDICRGLIGKTAKLNEPFKGDGGLVVAMPPAHVSCRCTTGLQTTPKRVARFFGRWWRP